MDMMMTREENRDHQEEESGSHHWCGFEEFAFVALSVHLCQGKIWQFFGL
jgi:hypothetical protein